MRRNGFLAHLQGACFLFGSLLVCGGQVDLSGQWGFSLDSDNRGVGEQWFTKDLGDSVELPGTLDTNQKGIAGTKQPEMTPECLRHLTRKYEYTGPAWYQREIEIPAAWMGKKITLHLERVLWESTVWIDGQRVGSEDSLVAPHVHDLTEYASVGRHRLTLRIDNSCKYNVGNHANHPHPIAHCYSDETQTIWNGVVGKIALVATDKVHIRDVRVCPDLKGSCAKLKVVLANESGQPVEGRLGVKAESTNSGNGHSLRALHADYAFAGGEYLLEMDYPMGDGFLPWDEFSPALYDLKLVARSRAAQGEFMDERLVRFGMREFGKDGGTLRINGRRAFLRGTLECCIFPLTGHPPTAVDDWLRIFEIARGYGLNHLRFHSWCPPEAAFVAADRTGFYLQVELPSWVPDAGQDAPRDGFLRREGHRILRAYGNHPSFCLMSMGNELSGDFSFIHGLVSEFKATDPRRLYTSTSFSFQGDYGKWPGEVDDYFITQHTTKGWVRGQGFFNHLQPSTDFDFQASTEGMPVPLVTHETGQYTVYPQMSEIDKYTGVLEPLNLVAIRNDLLKKGLLEQAPDFTQSTGRFAAELYKAEIELALRTPGTSGFQMLDLHDYPGQGTALIGILDAFWDSKGFISPERFSRFCAPTVLLARMPKFTYENNETFEAAIEVAHFGSEPLDRARVCWALRKENGEIVGDGRFSGKRIPIGNGTHLGDVRVDLDRIKKAEKLNLEVWLEDRGIANDWNIWVYPSGLGTEPPDDVMVSRGIDEAFVRAVEKGGKILFLPRSALFKEAIPGQFLPVFWSPVLFPNQPGSMGILCNPRHPAFASFPTEPHSDWHWWDLNLNSVVFKLDAMPRELEPIVRIIDDFSRNRRLATLVEFKIGGARILMVSMDLETDMGKRPVARQLRHSLLQYMASDRFDPQASMELGELKSLFKETTAMTNARIVGTSSFQPGYSAEQAIDGDPASMWSTAWSPELKKHPHEIVVDLGRTRRIRGFTCLPRQDGNPNGWISDFEAHVSPNGKEWDRPVAVGSFSKDASLKKVMFSYYTGMVYKEVAEGRYFRLVAKNGFNNDSSTTIAELDIVAE